MSKITQIKTADQNIKLYVYVRIFAKRVFLPLTAIYFIDNAGFTIRDIGLLSGFFSLIQLLAEVPTGYFADRIGRVASIRMGALLAAFATTIYATVHAKSGIYLGTMLEAIGYSFLGGAGEALIHDSLVVKKQVHEYTKILSRTMSISLVANAILITLTPMTYSFDHRYPFLIGSVMYLLLFLVTFFMHDVEREASVLKLKIPDIRKISGKRNILLFGLTFGIISALYTTPSDVITIALREYGVRVDLLGWIYGAASIVGAGVGYYIHYLRKVHLSKYLKIDLVILLSIFAAAYTRSAPILAVAMIIGISFWRYRKIIYQDYLLTIYPTQYKATLVSAMSNLEQLNAIWLPVAITYVLFLTNTSIGLGLIGLFGLMIAPIFYYSTLKFFHRDPAPEKLAIQATDVV